MTPDDAAEPVDELLAAAYALDSPEANRSLYARWAGTYDSEFVVNSRYEYHEQVAAVFAEHALAGLVADDVVVDIGCGTGLGGLALRRHRAITIDGVDISPEMLQQAAAKQHDGRPVYRALIEADLTQPVAIADGTYAAAMSVGTFTHGHVGPEAIAEVVRIVRRGGRVVLGINAAHFAAAGFRPVLDDLVARGLVTDVQLIDRPIYGGADMTDPDQFAHVTVLTVR
jgi:ubiquinone/menaquinone biosynthesis C-methylase UbiE